MSVVMVVVVVVMESEQHKTECESNNDPDPDHIRRAGWVFASSTASLSRRDPK